jgi:transcriptional regulator with XRE-family HTH domain
MGGARVAGELLRRWRRDVAGLDATQVAARLGRSVKTVYAWETGTATPDLKQVGELDAALEAGGALADMFKASGTPDGLDARVLWENNFPHHAPSPVPHPVWVWLREADSRSRKVRVELEWGPLHRQLRLPSTEYGVVVAMPASIANPPLTVRLASPGWADFGTGAFPEGLGLPVVSVLTQPILVERWHDTVRATRRLFHELDERREWRWLEHVPTRVRKTFADWFGSVSSSENSRDAEDVLDVSMEPLTDPLKDRAFPGRDLQRLRKARQMSRAETASEVESLLRQVGDDGPAATPSMIEALEQDAEPRHPAVRAMLDAVYSADGYTCCVEVQHVEGDHDVTGECDTEVMFPAWWVGPVWIRPGCQGGDVPQVVTLRWHGWEQQVRARPGQSLALRQAFIGDHHEPLKVTKPAYWSLEAGVGRMPCSIDVNVGWKISAGSAADEALLEARRSFFQAIGWRDAIVDASNRSGGTRGDNARDGSGDSDATDGS